MGSGGSELLGSLAELRGFVTDAERQALGDPLRPTTTDDPLRDLRDSSAAQFDRELQDERLEELFGLRVEVACHCLASLTDEEIGTLHARTSIPEEELIAARSLAAEALTRGIGERGKALFTLLGQLGESAHDDDAPSVHDLITEVRRLGRWPGTDDDAHVMAYRQALGEAVLRNARFAFWVACRYVRKPSPPMLLASLDGMRTALERFDPRRGFALTTYAQWWVRSKVTRAMSDSGADVRAPVYFWEDRGRLLRAMYAYVAEHGELPDRAALLAHTELSERVQVDKVLRLGLVPLRSVWTRTCDGAEPEADRLFHPELPTLRDQELEARIQEVLDEAIEGLKPRRAEIIRRRYGIGAPLATLSKIGEGQGVSRERVRQLQVLAVGKIAHRVGKELANAIQSTESL
ncbi:MAG TPA: hypothetical protein DEF51_54300 [Myxococcales bacterium]|nr:hypothetical protein [Myxococcales bacterium]